MGCPPGGRWFGVDPRCPCDETDGPGVGRYWSHTRPGPEGGGSVRGQGWGGGRSHGPSRPEVRTGADGNRCHRDVGGREGWVQKPGHFSGDRSGGSVHKIQVVISKIGIDQPNRTDNGTVAVRLSWRGDPSSYPGERMEGATKSSVFREEGPGLVVVDPTPSGSPVRPLGLRCPISVPPTPSSRSRAKGTGRAHGHDLPGLVLRTDSNTVSGT